LKNGLIELVLYLLQASRILLNLRVNSQIARALHNMNLGQGSIGSVGACQGWQIRPSLMDQKDNKGDWGSSKERNSL